MAKGRKEMIVTFSKSNEVFDANADFKKLDFTLPGTRILSKLADTKLKDHELLPQLRKCLGKTHMFISIHQHINLDILMNIKFSGHFEV